MTVTINADDPRTIRALELAAQAEYWLKGANPRGEEVFGLPSQSEPGQYHIVTDAETCTCPDFVQRGVPCKHVLAVRLYSELMRAQNSVRPRGHLRVLPNR